MQRVALSGQSILHPGREEAIGERAEAGVGNTTWMAKDDLKQLSEMEWTKWEEPRREERGMGRGGSSEGGWVEGRGSEEWGEKGRELRDRVGEE